LAEAHHRGRLTFAERRGCDRGDDHVLGLRAVRQLGDRVQLDLRDVLAVVLEQARLDAHVLGYFGNRPEVSLARDLEVAGHGHVRSPSW
jgi:hypothetical protein